jgi:23S rRNA pseudouridine2605 synthase
MRLNRYLASAGFGSRRSVESLITEGSVRINGQVVTSLSTTIAPGDVVKVGNRTVESQQHVHAIIHKPKGFICSSADEAGRRTILDLVPDDWPRVYNVGRLDKESEGLLVITNDGDLSLALTHPRYKVEKEYEVLLDRPFEPAHREKLLRGFHIEGGRAKMERISVEGPNRLRVVLLQGIKRQIRLMMYDCGYEVESLRRIRIGTVWLDRLRPGEWRMLNPKEVTALKEGRNPDPDAVPRAKTVAPAPTPRRREAATPIHKLPFQERPTGPRVARPSRRDNERDDVAEDFTRSERPMRRAPDARPASRGRYSDRDKPDERSARPFTPRPPTRSRTSRPDDRAEQPRSFRGRTPADAPTRRPFGDRTERRAARDAADRPAFAPRDNQRDHRDSRNPRFADKRPASRGEAPPRGDRPRSAPSDRARRTPPSVPRGRSGSDRPSRAADRPPQKSIPQKPSSAPKKKGWDAWD